MAIKIPAHLTGLQQTEVEAFQQAGEINQNQENLLKSDRQIIKENTVNVFNVLNLVLALLVIGVGSPKNALFFGVVIINTLIGVVQEIRAKHTIDKLSVLNKTETVVLRDQKLQTIPQEGIVLHDVIKVENGDQIPVDGKLLHGTLEVDESLLTGEADRIQKTVGEKLFSGSFVTAGLGFYEATAVGANNFAEKLASEAKTKKSSSSQLTKVLARMIAGLTIVIVPVGLGLFFTQYASTASFKQAILGTVAALVSMIPEGLMLLTSVAFAVGAANLARKKVLVQALPSIETLARVDVICLDKTGTITDGTLTYHDALLNGVTLEELTTIMTALLASLPDNNATATALRQHFSGTSSLKAKKVIPFSSARKWSGVTFEKGSYIMGAPEFIFKSVPAEVTDQLTPLLEKGYRVLALAKYPAELTEELTQPPKFLAALVITDNLRENAEATFSYFEKQAVELKVISGDHPVTVSKIAQKAGIKNAQYAIDMTTVNDTDNYQALVKQNAVFGRVTPYQKRRLIKALQNENHTVCMTGDGVNDVLALRQADIGVAMANGSSAARAAADVILLNSDFKEMQAVLNEGRRVINNIERVASMYLVKTIYSLCLAVIFMFLAAPYPFAPVQLTPINALTVGIPSFFLALKPSYERIKGDFLNNILRVSVPGAFTVLFSVLIIQLADRLFQLSFIATSTMSVFLTGCTGLIVLYTISQPLDKMKGLLIGVLSAAYLSCFFFFRPFFEFDQLLNRNAFFVIPLLFAIWWVFKGSTWVMGKIVAWRIKWQTWRKDRHKSRVM